MVSGFICGTNNFSKEEDDYERHTRSADSSPRKSRPSKSNKNPYSTRGLDKFSALLAEIEEKRQQIYSQLDPDQISLVRFVYEGDHEFKPIVVKVKPKNSADYNHEIKNPKIDFQKPIKLSKLNSSISMNIKSENGVENEGNKKMSLCRKFRVHQWRDSQLYLIIIVVLILMFLVLFGRSFAIMCTSIGWYVVPNITKCSNSGSNFKGSFKKKDQVIRRLSQKKLMTSEGTKSFKT
ncbi:uncharacterized protein LOC130811080 [Amaranthus tricolor]|uniref:uncharacterized protein LOC130811080 n=1 Tax=Amaranthus tricolor TaxID=29722 RepID=UPI00258D14FF|nr:uncharacterized protein LOC130811080 [Amaranthus tricolor]